MLESILLDLNDLWGAFNSLHPAEIADFRNSSTELARVSRSVEAINSHLTIRRKERDVSGAGTVEEIAAKAAELQSAREMHPDSVAAQAATGLKRIAQRKCLGLATSLLKMARQDAKKFRRLIAEQESCLAARFGIATKPTFLGSYVDKFEQEIAHMEVKISIASNNNFPPILPGLSVFEGPARQMAEPPVHEFPEEEVRVRRSKLDVDQQQADEAEARELADSHKLLKTLPKKIQDALYGRRYWVRHGQSGNVDVMRGPRKAAVKVGEITMVKGKPTDFEDVPAGALAEATSDVPNETNIHMEQPSPVAPASRGDWGDDEPQPAVNTGGSQ